MKAVFSKPQSLVAAIKDVDGKQGIVSGYFASFNNVDSDGDIIMPGAFTKTIRENGPTSRQPRIKHLLNHDPEEPLGVITSLQEDAKGLAYTSQIGTHEDGIDFIKMVESGLITEHSIGYEVIKWRSSDTQTVTRYGQQVPVRELLELKLWEGSSLTAWGANANTPITGLKSYYATRLPLLKSAITNGTFTDKTFHLLIQELDLIEKALTTTQPQESTVPDDEAINIIKQFNNSLAIKNFLQA